jgi:hypothetical protein
VRQDPIRTVPDPVLAQHKIAITEQERCDMLALTRQMKMGDIVPHALGFCPRVT